MKKRFHPPSPARRCERGSALIAVLCLLFTGGLITTAVLALSKTGTFTVAAHVERQRSMLVAEGALTRIQWLLAADLKLYPQEKLGETDYESYEDDRYLADNVQHELDYYGEKIAFRVHDTISGDDVVQDTTSVLNRLLAQETEEADWEEGITRFKSHLTDYLDSDDEVTDDGWESGDYEEAGLAPLPRNGAMQFREELGWLPGFAALYPVDRNGRFTAVRLIPPAGGAKTTGTPTLFTADARMIQNYCGIDEEKLPEVVDALEKWKNERILLSDTLDETLLAQLKSGLSTRESGLNTIVIEAPAGEPRPFARLTASYSAFTVEGPDEGKIEYLEWNFF